MSRIDERLNLAASAAPRLDGDSGQRDPDPAPAQEIIQASAVAEAKARDGGGGGGGGGGDNPIHKTLALPGIGLGYGSLDALQDQDMAFVMTDHGLTTITSGAQGYLVKSDVPMDATLAKILGFIAEGHGFADVPAAMARLSPTPAADAFDHGHTYGWDIKGGTLGDTVAGSQHDDLMHGLAGNDSLNGSAGDDIAWGGAGNDTLLGSEGDDQLWGGAGIDSLDGGMGDDFLFAGSGADTLLGGDGRDVLLGGIGNNALDGGAGDDLLVGGGNADKLTGGEGADTFLFAEGDSGVGDSAQDKVLDFTIGEDKLDLTGFTKSLHLVSEFHHHAYELVISDNADGTTLLQIDLNGDGVSDQEILVTSTSGEHIGAGDLVV